MDEESRTSRNSRLRNLNEEQFVSLGYSFDQRKPWKRKKKKGKKREKVEDGGRPSLSIVPWRRSTESILAQTTTHSENRIYPLGFRKRDVSVESRNFPFRPRKRKLAALSLSVIEASPTPFSLPAVGRVPWTNFGGQQAGQTRRDTKKRGGGEASLETVCQLVTLKPFCVFLEEVG